jgi:hypothetical protein
MAHLAKYQGKELGDICAFIGVPVSGTKDEQKARLKGKFTAEMARIFDAYGGFDKKPGDSTVKRQPLPSQLAVNTISVAALLSHHAASAICVHRSPS